VATSANTAETSGGAAISGRTPTPSAVPQQRGFGRLWRTLKQLFHELVGAAFTVLAIAWFNSLLRAWMRDAAHWLMALAACVVALFAFFAVTSFRKARKL
jgi:hypothetical protein